MCFLGTQASDVAAAVSAGEPARCRDPGGAVRARLLAVGDGAAVDGDYDARAEARAQDPQSPETSQVNV